MLLREQPTLMPSLMGLTECESLYFGRYIFWYNNIPPISPMDLFANGIIILALLCKDRSLNEFGIERENLRNFNEAAFRSFVKKCVVSGELAKFLEKRAPRLLDEAEAEICEFYLADSSLPPGMIVPQNGTHQQKEKDFRFYLKAYMGVSNS
jgi:hypothetical protein